MARFFNRTSGPLTASLPTGVTLYFAPKAFTEVGPADEGCGDIRHLMNAGKLARFDSEPETAPVAAQEPASVAVPEADALPAVSEPVLTDVSGPSMAAEVPEVSESSPRRKKGGS